MKNLRKKTQFIIAGVILVILLSCSLGIYLKSKAISSQVITPITNSQTDFSGVFPSITPDGIYNILLLGYGGADQAGSRLSDVIIVLHANLKNKTVAQISIPRDLFINIPNDVKSGRKINEAFTLGPSQANTAVSIVTGFPVTHYIAVDFIGIKKAVNALGGIDIEVPQTFTDNFYPIKGKELDTCGKSPQEIASLSASLSGFELEKKFECRYEKLSFKQGKTHMDGDTVLKFTGSRHSAEHGSDFARSMRQQAVLEALKDKIFSLQIFSSVHPLYKALTETVTTDLTPEIIAGIINSVGDPKQYTVTKIQLTNENVLVDSKNSNGQYILVPKEGMFKWVQIQEYIKQEFEKQS